MTLRNINRATDRLTDGQTDGQGEIQIYWLPYWWWAGKQTDRQMTVRHFDRGTDRLTDRKTDGQRGVQDLLTARLVDRKTDRQTYGRSKWWTDKQTDLLPVRLMGRETDRQTGLWRVKLMDRETHILIYGNNIDRQTESKGCWAGVGLQDVGKYLVFDWAWYYINQHITEREEVC